VATEERRPRSLEEAEIRKVEAETAEIEARTRERWARVALIVVTAGLLVAHHLG
jgi:hypothetical protein